MKNLLLELIPELPRSQLVRNFRRGLFAKTPLLCTVSGGQDSIVTLFVLLHIVRFPKLFLLRKNKKIKTLQILHCNHFWQPKNIVTSRFLFQLSFLFNLPYTLFLPEKQLLTENLTRSWRKRLFFRICYLNKSLFLITGHTQSDLIETKLNQLFRGTSLKKLESTVAQKKRSGYFFSYQIFSFKTFQLGSHSNNQKTNKTVISLVLQKMKGVRHSPKLRCGGKNFFVTKREPDFKFKKVFFKKSDFTFVRNVSFVSVSNCSENSKTGKKLFFQSLYPFQKESKNSSCFVFYSSSTFLLPRTLKPLENQARLCVSKISNFYEFPVSIDRTNFSIKFSRNQIRQQLLPIINLLIKKEISSSFLHFFEIFQSDSEVLERQTSLLYFLLTLVQSEVFEKQENFKFSFISFQLIFDQSILKRETKNFILTREIIKQNCQRSIQNLILQKMYRHSQERDLSFVHISTFEQDFLK